MMGLGTGSAGDQTEKEMETFATRCRELFRTALMWSPLIVLVIAASVLAGWRATACAVAAVALFWVVVHVFAAWRRPILSPEDEAKTNEEFRRIVNPTNFPFGRR